MEVNWSSALIALSVCLALLGGYLIGRFTAPWWKLYKKTSERLDKDNSDLWEERAKNLMLVVHEGELQKMLAERQETIQGQHKKIERQAVELARLNAVIRRMHHGCLCCHHVCNHCASDSVGTDGDFLPSPSPEITEWGRMAMWAHVGHYEKPIDVVNRLHELLADYANERGLVVKQRGYTIVDTEQPVKVRSWAEMERKVEHDG